MDTDAKGGGGGAAEGPAGAPLPSGRKWLFRLLVLALLGAYGWHSHAGFRVASRGRELARRGKPATARAAFRFVLDRQSFSLAVPLARASLLTAEQSRDETPGEERLAVWPFEDAVDRTVKDAITAAAQGRRVDTEGWRLSPLTCDFAPAAWLATAILLSAALTSAFFLRKRAGFFRRVFALLAIGVLLAWVLADPSLGLREWLAAHLAPGPAQALLLIYDYLKYVLGALFLLLTLRQWFYVGRRWPSAQGVAQSMVAGTQPSGMRA